jgi:hypothetical protein
MSNIFESENAISSTGGEKSTSRQTARWWMIWIIRQWYRLDSDTY